MLLKRFDRFLPQIPLHAMYQHRTSICWIHRHQEVNICIRRSLVRRTGEWKGESNDESEEVLLSKGLNVFTSHLEWTQNLQTLFPLNWLISPWSKNAMGGKYMIQADYWLLKKGQDQGCDFIHDSHTINPGSTLFSFSKSTRNFSRRFSMSSQYLVFFRKCGIICSHRRTMCFPIVCRSHVHT